jgi:hypothetical protein
LSELTGGDVVWNKFGSWQVDTVVTNNQILVTQLSGSEVPDYLVSFKLADATFSVDAAGTVTAENIS